MKIVVCLILAGIIATSSLAQQVGPCKIFPSDNWWNIDISKYPVHPLSDKYLAKMGLSKKLHPDFGSPAEYGIPYVVVGADQPFVQISYDQYGWPGESDPGPYPIPQNAPIEGAGNSGDQHVIAVDTANCTLYELYLSSKDASGTGWTCYSSAKYDLTSNVLRPDGWTSADAAGLPIFPGLVRYDEVLAGEINHALRFTTDTTQRGYITPARHFASKFNDTTFPPMGLRVRLKESFDISSFTGMAKVILVALKKYGLILADNGSDWFISGATDPRWPDDDINTLKKVPASAFEAIYSGPVKHGPESSVTTANESSYFSIYPNPASSQATIEFTAGDKSTLTITDMLGRTMEVIHINSDISSINYGTKSLPQGSYIVCFEADGTISRQILQVLK
jgi:hypothetical protein